MGEATAAPVQFLLKGIGVTVGQFGALPSTSNYDQIGIYTSGSVTLPANTYGLVVDGTVLSSLLRTSTPRSLKSMHNLGHKEPVESFRLVEPEAPGVTQSLAIAGAYPAGSHVTLTTGQMLLVGRTGVTGPYAGNALQRTAAYGLPVRVTMSDSGWGGMDDVMDGKYQLVRNGLAQTTRPGWSDPWPWSCMGIGYGCFRTAVGRNGNTGWIAIVGVPKSYGGLTTPDWGRVLKALGATQAMGFDANSAAELYRAGSGSVTNGDGGRIIPSATALRYN